MKLTMQAPWAILAVISWPLFGVITWFICGNATAGVINAFIGAFMVWMVGRDKMQNHEAVLEDPPARLINAPDFDVMAAIKESMEDNIGDKWWTRTSLDDAPDEEGRTKAKYIMKYKEEFKSDPPQLLDRQLILKIEVEKVASQTSVKLNYQVASEKIRWTANEILEATTAMIWSRLSKLESARGAKRDETE